LNADQWSATNRKNSDWVLKPILEIRHQLLGHAAADLDQPLFDLFPL